MLRPPSELLKHVSGPTSLLPGFDCHSIECIPGGPTLEDVFEGRKGVKVHQLISTCPKLCNSQPAAFKHPASSLRQEAGRQVWRKWGDKQEDQRKIKPWSESAAQDTSGDRQAATRSAASASWETRSESCIQLVDLHQVCKVVNQHQCLSFGA